MTKKRAERSPPIEPRPQQYEHHVEVVIEALASTIAASDRLVQFLHAQETSRWRHSDDLLQTADGDLRRARRWLAKEMPRRKRR
jgi:hypothetical protein